MRKDILIPTDDWNTPEHKIEITEIVAARLEYFEVKQHFSKNPPEMLTLEQISQEYLNQK